MSILIVLEDVSMIQDPIIVVTGKYKRHFSILKINPIQDGGRGGKKASPISFSHVTSTNVEISPKIFPTFSFNPFATLI